MKILFLILLLSLRLNLSFAERVRGKFLSSPEQSSKFIRDALLFSATVEAVKQELIKMRLNADVFFEKLNEGWEKRAAEIKESEKFKDKPRDLINHLEVEKQKFYSFSRFVTSYQIQLNSRSSSDPLLRYLDVDMVLNQNRLMEYYHQLLNSEDLSQAVPSQSKLYVELNIEGSPVEFSPANVIEQLVPKWRGFTLIEGPQAFTKELRLMSNEESTLIAFLKIKILFLEREGGESLFWGREHLMVEYQIGAIAGNTGSKAFEVNSGPILFQLKHPRASSDNNLISALANHIGEHLRKDMAKLREVSRNYNLVAAKKIVPILVNWTGGGSSLAKLMTVQEMIQSQMNPDWVKVSLSYFNGRSGELLLEHGLSHFQLERELTKITTSTLSHAEKWSWQKLEGAMTLTILPGSQ